VFENFLLTSSFFEEFSPDASWSQSKNEFHQKGIATTGNRLKVYKMLIEHKGAYN
jgi:hypothetical protein